VIKFATLIFLHRPTKYWTALYI